MAGLLPEVCFSSRGGGGGRRGAGLGILLVVSRIGEKYLVGIFPSRTVLFFFVLRQGCGMMRGGATTSGTMRANPSFPLVWIHFLSLCLF